MEADVLGNSMEGVNRVTTAIIGFAISIHRELGPGLLESAYEECLVHELQVGGFTCDRQRPLPISYKGIALDCGYRLDLVVEEIVLVELKAVTELQPIHDAQILTYLKLSGIPLGLLINFNVPVLKWGIRRFVKGKVK